MNNAEMRSFFGKSKFDIISKEQKQKLRYDVNNNRDGVKEKLRQLTPEEIFSVFDEDDSGLISFEEFRKLLPYLGIFVNDAKAFRYFRLCDVDNSGHIDIDEFKIVLFLCDPTSGNQVGYSPKKYVTPLDAFELFDEDHSGDMDEDEFAYAMEYLGVKISDAEVENLFDESDKDKSGKIDYEEFRDTFIQVCDVRVELEERGIDVPLFTKVKKLRQLLCSVVLEEEKREHLAVAETLKYKEWMSSVKEKKIYVERLKFRAYHELRKALDLSGQVYVFGNGLKNQFTENVTSKYQTTSYQFEHMDKVISMWRDRVRPQEVVDKVFLQRKTDQMERKREYDRRKRRGDIIDDDLYKPNHVLDPYMEAKHSLFSKLNVAVNTAGLYGRRIHEVAVSESVIFALADTGEIYSWGGQGYTWHEIQQDSINQFKWRGDTTPRSQMLLGTTGKQLPLEDDVVNSINFSSDDRKIEMIKVITKYFNVWEPPPDSTNKLGFMEKELLPKISFDDIKFSLFCRGKNIEFGSKMELVEALFHDIMLEKKLLGEKAHKAIKLLESQVSSLVKRKKDFLVKKILMKIDQMWKPLREVQEHYLEAEKAATQQVSSSSSAMVLSSTTEKAYKSWRKRVKENKLTSKNRKSIRPIEIPINGITPRGQILHTPRAESRIMKIAAGCEHACALHESGQIYTWGVGISGRLGHSNHDVETPQLVTSLIHTKISSISCGHNHSGAITMDGDLFMWGSTNTGKLGIGDFIANQECYSIHCIPLVIPGLLNRKVIKLSCGYSHSGLITEDGQVYMFGCGDGGRLGLSEKCHDGNVYSPTLITDLSHERIATISCGSCSTLVATEIKYENFDDDGVILTKRIGGKVYVAGSSNVLGCDYPIMTLVKEIEHIPITHVSAGFRHSAVVSADGELLCWGSNYGGCCGIDPNINFVHKPELVKALYYQAENLATGSDIYQSSTFLERHASFAINGKKDGMGLHSCSCTQEESHAWLEVNLGFDAIIDEIWIWNRTDSPKAHAGELPKDFFTSRLFPMWVMIGKHEFEKGISLSSFQRNLSNASAKKKFTENKRITKWRCNSNNNGNNSNGLNGQYVRIQLQEFNFLHIAEIEIFGRPRVAPGVGRITHVSAGRDVTVAVISPSINIHEIELAYESAIYCDQLNRDILRQFETYALLYEKFQYHNSSNSNGSSNPCPLCFENDICEVCKLKEKYGNELDMKADPSGSSNSNLFYVDKIAEQLLENDMKISSPMKTMESKNERRKWKFWSSIFTTLFAKKTNPES